MNGFTTAASQQIAVVTDLDWQVAGVDDFNGDGKADILWRNTVTGFNVIWQMNGFTTAASQQIAVVTDLNWQIENRK